MNKNILIVLAGGFVIAILVAVLVQAGFSDKKKAEVSEAKTEILVAARPLKVGGEITDKDVKWQEWPETMIFEGAIRRTDDKPAHEAISGRLKERVATGQPLHKNMTVDADKGNMLAASLTPGYRAVGIRVPVETIAGGLIGVGDRVDVLMTYKLTRTGNSTIARKFGSETILENIRVLGLDTKSVAQDLDESKGKKSKSRLTVTLEVDAPGAEKLALANEMGDVHLALRPLGDAEPVPGDKATTDVGLSKVLGEMVGGNGAGSVRIYNGTQMQYLVSGGGLNDQLGRDGNDTGVDESYDAVEDGDMLPPEGMMDAVREGIADGIARGLGGEEE